MIRGIIILCCLGAGFATRSANQYIENVLQTTFINELRSLGLEPAPLPNFNIRFDQQGNAAFTNGNITGFSRVRRASECSGPKLFRNELTINCTLSLYPVTTNYRVTARNGSAVSNIRSVGHVAETTVYVVISGQPQNYVGSVKSFQVTRLGVITPTFPGLSPAFNRYLGILQEGYRSNVSSYLYDAIQQRFVYALGRALAYKPMPRQ